MASLEVCVDSFESAEAAIRGGAHRLELCAALSEGGLTPTVGLLKAIKNHYPDTPIFAMLRPTNRITYEVSAADMDIIRTDMQLFYEHGIDGYVFGALKKVSSRREIDVELCNWVVRNSHNLPVTFHRAIDMTGAAEKFNSLNIIEACGFKRVLSSGFAATAIQGIDNLAAMQEFTAGRCIIMPGCGVTVSNVDDILRRHEWSEFHASARTRKVAESSSDDSDFARECLVSNPFYVTCEKTVRKLVDSGKRRAAQKI